MPEGRSLSICSQRFRQLFSLSFACHVGFVFRSHLNVTNRFFLLFLGLALAARVRRVSSAPLSTFSAGIASQICKCFAVLFAKVFYYRASNRIPDLHDRLGVLRLRNPYKDYPGFVYAVMRPHVGPNGVVDYTRMEIKVGITNDLERRMRDYKKCGDGFVWLFSYRSRSVKWIGKFVRATVRKLTRYRMNGPSDPEGRRCARTPISMRWVWSPTPGVFL